MLEKQSTSCLLTVQFMESAQVVSIKHPSCGFVSITIGFRHNRISYSRRRVVWSSCGPLGTASNARMITRHFWRSRYQIIHYSCFAIFLLHVISIIPNCSQVQRFSVYPFCHSAANQKSHSNARPLAANSLDRCFYGNWKRNLKNCVFGRERRQKDVVATFAGASLERRVQDKG